MCSAKTSTAPKHHHLDRRADEIASAATGVGDELLTTSQVAAWLGVSIQWAEIARSKNYGPPFQRVGPRVIRYRRADVLAWLKTRTHSCTSEYASGKAVA